jgi:hypothetical protein
MAKQQFKQRNRRKKATPDQQPMLFDTGNYIYMGIGVGLILTGFLIMYLESEVRGFWSLYVSPLIVLAGFGTVAYSIMRKRTDIADLTGNEQTGSSSTGTVKTGTSPSATASTRAQSGMSSGSTAESVKQGPKGSPIPDNQGKKSARG